MIDAVSKARWKIIVKNSFTKGKKGYYSKCRCKCGTTRFVSNASLKNGSSKSCGCLNREVNLRIKTTHGKSHSKIYAIWHTMIQRCYNKKDKQYKNYGARGIRISREWRKFENFYKDMGDKPNGLSIDRINNNKGYSKLNCRWATNKEQCQNMRINRMVNFMGEKISISELSRRTNMSSGSIRYRLEKYGEKLAMAAIEKIFK